MNLHSTSHRSSGFIPQQRARGFTLIEIILVIALTSGLLALSLILSMETYRGTLFRSTREVLVSSLSTARGRAMSNLYETPHGVCYSAPNFIIFRGTTYSASAATNETIPGNASVTLTSPSNFFTCGTGTGIRFSQLAATTSDTGTITITGEGHSNQTVNVTSLGTIVW